MRRIYYNQEMGDCYYEVYALCQEGMVSIKYEKVDFDKGEDKITISVCMHMQY